MSVLVDTSAIYSLLDSDDDGHERVAAVWRELLEAEPERLLTTDFTIVETAALVQRRLGFAAARALFEGFVPLLALIYVDETLLKAGCERFLGSRSRSLSLVDCVSIEAVLALGIDSVLALDLHFSKAGLEVIPSSR